MWKCENCGSEVDSSHATCWKCGTGKDGSPPADKPKSEESRPKTLVTQSSAEPSAFASALRLCGVINLVASLIGGYIIWSNAPSSYYTFSGSSGYYFGLAMAVVLQGIFFFVFFNVVAEIAETLKAILHKLSGER